MQIIKYSWDKFEPKLVLKDDQITRMNLFDKDISIKFNDKICIGFYNGKHYPCPERRILEYGYNCIDCRKSDRFSLCMQCTGEECINPKRRDECKEEEYFVYLAVFDSLIKVGVSLDRRIIERLVEQGADFGARLMQVKDGKEVRIIERNIMNTLNITDRVRGNQKAERIFCNPNVAMKNLYKNIINLKNLFPEKLNNIEIHDLRNYYRLHNVKKDPKLLKVSNGIKLEGRVVAAKGNIVILNNQNMFYSLNAHEMVGREVEINN